MIDAQQLVPVVLATLRVCNDVQQEYQVNRWSGVDGALEINLQNDDKVRYQAARQVSWKIPTNRIASSAVLSVPPPLPAKRNKRLRM